MLVQHLILSHHGSYEFGSPSLPQIPEAVALHFIDDIDSKMAGMRKTLEQAPGSATVDMWTERNPSLRRVADSQGQVLGGTALRKQSPKKG